MIVMNPLDKLVSQTGIKKTWLNTELGLSWAQIDNAYKRTGSLTPELATKLEDFLWSKGRDLDKFRVNDLRTDIHYLHEAYGISKSSWASSIGYSAERFYYRFKADGPGPKELLQEINYIKNERAKILMEFCA